MHGDNSSLTPSTISTGGESTTVASSDFSPESPVLVSSHTSLAQAIHERRAEYTRPRKLRVKVGTWNVAGLSGTENDIGGWFVKGKGVSEALSKLQLKSNELAASDKQHEREMTEAEQRQEFEQQSANAHDDLLPLDIYALGLQEIVDISSAAEALRPYKDPSPAQKWKQAVMEALPAGYELVAEQQLVGLYLIVIASSEINSAISAVSTFSVGTGLGGYMGNKGAVGVRLVVGDITQVVFINCHLSAGAGKASLDRRNWDASQIQSRMKFEPIKDWQGTSNSIGGGIGDEDFAFWFGDLNYRLEDIPPEDVRRLLMLHTNNEYKYNSTSQRNKEPEGLEPTETTTLDFPISVIDNEEIGTASDSSTTAKFESIRTGSSFALDDDEEQNSLADPTSLHTTLSSLLPHDQLHKQMLARKAFHNGWREGPIEFLPTYKYDIGSTGSFDSSEKRRGPSWCDRILYRTRKDRLDYDMKIEEESQSRKKDDELRQRGIEDAAKDEDVLFDYDPDTDGADYDEHEPSENPDPIESIDDVADRLRLEFYASHQQVLSSDHKPLEAVFDLEYDVVDPELRGRVHQEVARELDKAENDGRPSVTIVFDHHERGEIDADRKPHFEIIDFGDVKFDHQYTCVATIANTGRVPANVCFADRSIDADNPIGVGPAWLSIRIDNSSIVGRNESNGPGESTLQPGDAVNFELSLLIQDFNLAYRLNRGEEILEDVLVLRIHNGRDYFLPLKANWLPSVFGRTLDDLVRLPDGGVRMLSRHSQDSSEQSSGDMVKRSAPRELFRLTESIESFIERAIGEWEMQGEDRSKLGEALVGWPFQTSEGDNEQIISLKEKIRDALDCDISLSEIWPVESTSLQRLIAVAQTLVSFVQGLHDGIITASLWTDLERASLEREKSKTPLSTDEERTQILDVLSVSPTHSVSFTFVTFALSRLAGEIVPLRVTTPASPSQAFKDAFQDQLRAHDEAGQRRRRVESAYAAIFADAIIRTPQPAATATPSGKAKKSLEARKRRILEIFLAGYS